MSTSPRKRPASEALIAGGVVVLLIAIVGIVFYSGAGSALYPPKPATTQAPDISSLYDIVFAIAVAIFVTVEGLIVWSILRYRRRPTDIDLPPQTHGNNLVEVLWTLIPTVIVLYMFVISWQTLNTVEYTSVANGRSRTSRSTPSQASSSGSSSTWTRTASSSPRRLARSATVAAWPCRSARRST